MRDSEPPKTNPRPELLESPVDALPDPGIEAFRKVLRAELDDFKRDLIQAVKDIVSDVADDRLEEREQHRKMWEEHRRRQNGNGSAHA